MSSPAERQRARERAADAIVTRHEVTIRRKEWWPSPPSKLSRAEQVAASRARKRAAREAAKATA